MNTTEIVQQNPSETQLDQPNEQTPVNPIHRPIDLMSTIRKWNPTGIRVVCNLPLIGDDRGFLFLLRCSPYIPHLSNDEAAFSSVNSIAFATNLATVVHDSDFAGVRGATSPTDLWSFSRDPGIYITTHSAPPLISDIARSCRFWRGGLSFRIRSKASFTHSAIMFTTPLYGVKPYYTPSLPTNARTFIPSKDKFSYLPYQANSYAYADLSMTRHFEIAYNYSKPTEWVDQGAIMALVANQASTGSLGDVPRPYAKNSWFEDYIGVGLRGSIDNSSSGTNQVEFEIDIKANDDFEFSGEHLYFNPLSDHSIAMHGLLGNYPVTTSNFGWIGSTAPADTMLTPRKYSNPQFSSGTTPTFYYQSGNMRIHTPYVIQ